MNVHKKQCCKIIPDYKEGGRDLIANEWCVEREKKVLHLYIQESNGRY